MVCLQDNDHNDTIDICLGDVFSMMPYDTLGNPMASTDSCIRYLAYVGWDTTGLGGNFFFSTSTTCTGPSPVNSFLSLQTGSFDLMFTDTIVRASSCDSDTVIFQSGLLHVNVNPVPTGGSFPVSISAASTQLCPGSTLALVAVGGGTLTWTDPNGQLLPPSDTVYATVPGTYSLAADSTVTNSFGCSAPVSGFASITITSYAQPVVTAQPVTGVICPNDSVKLTCSGTGGYTWQGPSGTLVQTDSVIYVASPGAYSCVLAADSSCNLLSNTIQVSAYSNPFVLAFPAPGLCDNNPVQLTVVSSLGSNIQWQPPLSGSQPVQTVSDSGTYTCTVVSCGITSPLSFTVYRDTAVAMIYTASSPPEFCAGDSVWLTANTGMAHYDWQPSGDSTLATYVTQGGLVTLVTTSTYGCTDTATILVTEQPNTLVPPAVTDTSVCSGFPADLVATGPDTICWAYSPSYSDTFLTGNVLHLGAVTNPVSYYVYTRSGLCKSAFDTVTAGVDPCHDIFIPNVFTPDGDNLNDFFPGKSGNYSLDMKVYNRWGRLVYESAAMDTGWDGRDSGGKLVGSGTYYYVMDVTFLDDSVENFRGAITVISGQ
jgi:gliding motility-associated-like protein